MLTGEDGRALEKSESRGVVREKVLSKGIKQIKSEV